METNNQLNKKLQDLKLTLPAQLLADYFELYPFIAENITESQKEQFLKGMEWTLSFLAESVWAGQPSLFEESVKWGKTFFPSEKMPLKYIAGNIELMKKRINLVCTDEENEIVNPILNNAVAMLLSDDQKLSLAAMDNHLSPLAQNYLESLLKGNRENALSLILNEVKAGAPVKEMYIQVFQPVQYEIGRLWQTNKISVAQEHYCTGATQLVMSQLYPYLFTGEKKNRKMVMTCVPGELHEMGARMVTDFFEMSGWDTYYLGANMPLESVVRYIVDKQPQCLAISATMTFHVSAVEELIRLIRLAPGIHSDLKIMVGGYPFKVAEGLWKTIGADGYAQNATDAIELADKLTAA
jgi:methanogenic corrinoid protein MtbC1